MCRGHDSINHRQITYRTRLCICNFVRWSSMFDPSIPINLTLQMWRRRYATAARRDPSIHPQAPAWNDKSHAPITPLTDSTASTPSTIRAYETGSRFSFHTNIAIAEHVRSGAHTPFPHGVTTPFVPTPHSPTPPSRWWSKRRGGG